MASLKAAVIGNGPLTLSVAGQLASRGACVTCIDPQPGSKTVQTLKASPVLHFVGEATYDAVIADATEDLSKASEVDLVVVSVPPSQRDVVFPELASYIRDGQHLLFFPASFGAIVFSALLKGRDLKDITVSESVSYPYVCAMSDASTIFVQSIKQTLGLAVLPQTRQDALLAMYNHYFDIYRPSSNCVETSLDNMNMTLHPLPVLMNLGAMDGDLTKFRHYIDGVTPHVAQLMEALDGERMALGQKLGISLTSTLDQLKQFYGINDAAGIGEYVSDLNGPYPEVRGFGLNSRYVTEDVPFLLVAMEALGKAAGVPTPVATLTVDIASAVMGTDYRAIGYSLEKLGLSGSNAAEMMANLI